MRACLFMFMYRSGEIYIHISKNSISRKNKENEVWRSFKRSIFGPKKEDFKNIYFKCHLNKIHFLFNSVHYSSIRIIFRDYKVLLAKQQQDIILILCN